MRAVPSETTVILVYGTSYHESALYGFLSLAIAVTDDRAAWELIVNGLHPHGPRQARSLSRIFLSKAEELFGEYRGEF
jgi:hypothetical protein